MACKPKHDGTLVTRRPGFLRQALEDYAQAGALAEAGLHDQALGVMRSGGQRRKIVSVSTETEFPQALISQSLSLAVRLKSEVVALSVGRVAPEGAGAETAGRAAHRLAAQELFAARAAQSARVFADQARASGVAFSHQVVFGKPGEAIERVCARLRRVEFVLAMREHKERERFSVSMPVFEVTG